MERVEVLIASPSDVADERAAVLRIFSNWNSAHTQGVVISITAESAGIPSLGDYPQHILNDNLIERSALMVAIFWARLGTPTPSAKSGTVEEIREFIKLKGPKRVMLYFCTRDLPNNIDPAELARLRDFKSEMQSAGLYCDYNTVKEFEGVLYRHLDAKVQQLMQGKLPLPKTEPAAVVGTAASNARPADSRLHELIDFGTSLQDIAAGFATRMMEFRRMQGGGPDKFLDLGTHVCVSCAKCLDRFLSLSAAGLRIEDRDSIERISNRLKRLAAGSSDYVKKFPEFWEAAQELSDDLTAHVKLLRRGA